MGHLAAMLSRAGEDVFPVLKRMLKAATSSVGDSYGFASEDGAFLSPSLNDGSLESAAVIGYRLEKVTQYDALQPVVQNGNPLIFEGRLTAHLVSNHRPLLMGLVEWS